MKTYKKLSDISELVGGYAFKSDNYVSNGIRVVRITNVQDGYFSDEHPCFYPVSITRELGKAMLQENDLLMSLTGNVGRVAFLPNSMLPAGLNQRVECIRVGDENLKKYLYYYFQSVSFINEAVRNSTGVAQLNLSTKWLGEHLIPVVSPNESASIVKNLETINLAIKKCEQELIYYDELTKSRFIELFLSNNQFPIKKWSDVLTIYNGRDYKANLSDEINGYPVYGSGGFMNVYADKYLCEGTLTIIGRKGTIDKPILVKGKIWNIDTAFGIKTNDKILNPIFFHYRSKFYDYKGMNKQTTKPSLTKTDLLKLDIELPPIEDQLGFVSFVNQIDKLKFSI